MNAIQRTLVQRSAVIAICILIILSMLLAAVRMVNFNPALPLALIQCIVIILRILKSLFLMTVTSWALRLVTTDDLFTTMPILGVASKAD
jgi:hypothetical protein